MNNQAALYLVAPLADAVEFSSSHSAAFRVSLPLTSRVIFFSGIGTAAVASAGLFPATRLLVSAGVVLIFGTAIRSAAKYDRLEG